MTSSRCDVAIAERGRAGTVLRNGAARMAASPARSRAGRLASLALVVCALALALGAVTARASLFSPVSTFGSQGSGAGQLNSPSGVTIQQSSGNMFVADSGNARVEKFDAKGNFILAFGWGVADGKAQAEVCTSSCQAGIPGSGQGQFSNPRSIAFDNATGGAFAHKVFVGDAGNNVVEEFNADGGFLATIDGTSTPQGHFQSLAGVATDQAGNLWTIDGSTNNIDEFNSSGKFAQQWTDTHGSPTAIAVDSTNKAVYLMTVASVGSLFPITERWTLTGQSEPGEIDRGVFYGSQGFFGPSPSALALDPSTGNLYVDHNSDPLSDVRIYDHIGIPLDDLSLGSTDNSQGLAFGALTGGSAKPGQHELYVSDATNDNVTIYGPQSTAGPPLVTSESANQTGKTAATLGAGIVPLGNDTTCKFQYVDNGNFNASGYKNATSVACTPADLGSSFTYQAATANVSGLTTGVVYHFRVIAASSAGTSTGASQEFQAGPGAWTPVFRCPVDDPTMLAASVPFCLASNSTHGSITIGQITTATGNTNLQVGLLGQGATIVSPSSGAIVADPVQIPNTPVGTVTAVTTSAGTPSNLNLGAGFGTGAPIITIPIKIQLENPALGSGCFIGSDQNPILLNPENTDLSNAKSVGGFFTFDPNGVPDPAGPLEVLMITGAVQGDDTFSVPGATGCGPNGSLDSAVDAVVGLPSPSGSNHLVLDDASSALVVAFGVGGGLSGQQFANYWHAAFG